MQKITKHLLLPVFILLSIITCSAQAPDWGWAKTAAGSINTYGMTTDISGNSYVTGYFSGGSITLGSFTLTNTGSWDMFIAKYDPNGNVLWAKSAGGNNNAIGERVATDNAGNVYVVGCFESSSITFGSTTLTDAGASYKVFLVKYDANGNAIWAKGAGDGSSTDNGIGITADKSGNVIITGYYQNSTIVFGIYTLTSTDYQNTFIAKYNSAGNVLWAKTSTGGGSNGSSGNAISSDAKGNVYITGSNNGGALTFGSYTLNPIGSADAFTVKYDSSGNVRWAKSFGGTGGTGQTYGESIEADTIGNIYITGYFNATTATFGSTSLTNGNYGGIDIAYYIAKYDSSGNPQWAQSAGGWNDVGNGLAIDANNNVYVSGSFVSSTFTLGTYTLHNTNPSPGTYGPGNAFFAKYDGTGKVLWAYSAGASDGNAYASAIAIKSDNIYVYGNFQSDSIALGSNILTNANPGSPDLFLAKLSTCGLTVSAKTVSSACGGNTGTAFANITNGRSPYTYLWSNGDKTDTAKNLASGEYLVTVTDASGCSNSAIAMISDTGGPRITVTSLKNVSCNSGSNGSITISVAGGNSPYTYVWGNGATTSFISNLTASPYQVEVTDAGGCKANKDISVSQPAPISISLSATSTSSCKGGDGTATATVSGGTGAYTYVWSTTPVQTNYNATGLAAGEYTLTVTDKAGCVDTARADVSNNGGSSPVVTVTNITNAACSKTNGTVTLSVNGGTGSYTYLWSNGATTSNLTAPAGYYNVTVTDAGGCIGTNSAQIPGIVPSGVAVCIVTVDTGSTHNIVVWDKTGVTRIDSFRLYYMNYQSKWQLIKAVPFSGPNYIVDNTPVNNPNANTVRYCLTGVDSCGNEEHFAASAWQNTMHINMSPPGTFTWSGTGYLKENVSLPVVSYYLYRDSIRNGNWKAIDSISGTQNTMTDVAYQAKPSNYPLARWYVGAVLDDSIGSGCTVPVLKPEKINYNASKSNTIIIEAPLGNPPIVLNPGLISVFPNPANQVLNIKFSNTKAETIGISILDVAGREVYFTSINNHKLPADNVIGVNVASLPAGVYFVRVTNGFSQVIKFIKL